MYSQSDPKTSLQFSKRKTTDIMTIKMSYFTFLSQLLGMAFKTQDFKKYC